MAGVLLLVIGLITVVQLVVIILAWASVPRVYTNRLPNFLASVCRVAVKALSISYHDMNKYIHIYIYSEWHGF